MLFMALMGFLALLLGVVKCVIISYYKGELY